MNGIRFYQEYTDSRKTQPTGTVVAVLAGTEQPCRCGDGRPHLNVDAIVGVFDRPDSPVASSGVALAYLRRRTRRISEAAARQVHPQLFTYLDRED